MIRVYYNKRGGLPWSVDFGTTDSEIQVRHIHFEFIAKGQTRTDFDQKDPEQPTGWIEFEDVQLRMVDRDAFIEPKQE